MKPNARKLLAGACMALATTAAQAKPETLDLVVLYTADALQHPNGHDMDARIAAAVEWTNQAYRNSRIDARIRLVHTEQVGAAYAGNLQNHHLDQLRRDAEVNRLRQEHGADFVTLVGPSNAWCGLGYVIQGNSATGQLHQGASSWPYNLVSISCGHATFAHELGHNMGLGHSNAQNSQGGVWPWARGHGEQGRFVTIMGYTSAFNTWNRLQYFSNPDLTECEGSRCGVDRNHPQGADSARNVNLLASQMADFLPTRHPGNGGGDDGDDDTPGETSEWRRLVSATDVCMEVAGGQTQANTPINPARCTQGDNQRWQLDAQQRLRPKHAPELCLGIGDQPVSGATARLSQCSQQAAQRWTFNGELIRNQANPNLVLDVYQQQGHIGLWSAHGGDNQRWSWDEVDEGSSTELCDKPHLAGNLVLDGDFNELSPWSTFENSGRLERVTQERDCGLEHRLRITDRTYWYTGPIQDITDQIRDGGTFKLSLLGRMEGDGSQRDTLWVAVRLVDDAGSRWQYLGSKSVTGANFDRLETEFTPEIHGHLREATLLVYGPAAGNDLLLDEVLLTASDTGEQHLLSSRFESDVDGWRDAYGALANRSAEQAADGGHGLKITQRRYWYAGTKRDINGLVESGQRYRLSFDALIGQNNRSSQRVDVQLLVQDGGSTRWIRAFDQPVATGQWQGLEGILDLRGLSGDLELAELHIFGPGPGVVFHLDNIRLEPAD